MIIFPSYRGIWTHALTQFKCMALGLQYVSKISSHPVKPNILKFLAKP